MDYDKIIIGAGLYGLYAAERCARRGEHVLVLEHDAEPFSRATYVNQARVHMGYHYPRSYSTAIKSAGYFKRFTEDYGFCVQDGFEQVYALGAEFSWTDAAQFEAFCKAADIRCDPIEPRRYFRPGMCDGAFLTTEYAFDARLLRDDFLRRLRALPGATLRCGARIASIRRENERYCVKQADGSSDRAPFVLNAAYASANQVLSLVYRDNADWLPAARQSFFPAKYELCEIILVDVDEPLRDVGLTVMDGPFFSIMPFGKTGLHSLTAVAFTPHSTCYDTLPRFPCQAQSRGGCAGGQLGNCNLCPARPASAWQYMSRLAEKFLRPELGFAYRESLFSMKPILKTSEIDDSRPTVIRKQTDSPTLLSVLSGKINTVYDLDEVL